jgi:carboxypeptidase family protein
VRKITVFVSLLFTAAVSINAALFASDAVIRGVVNDTAGKPVRGAMVKATIGGKTVSRFSQKDGRYEITLPAGKYNVSADAFGYSIASQPKDTAEPGDINFSLAPKMDVMRLSGAEMVGLLPETAETRNLKINCIGCHTWHTILLMRGRTAAQYRAYLPNMTNTIGRVGDWPVGGAILLKNRQQIPFSPEAINTIANMVEKYFGANAAGQESHQSS